MQRDTMAALRMTPRFIGGVVAAFTVAAASTASEPPLRVSFDLPVSGDVAIVIDDANGRRVRNVKAQIHHEAGRIKEAWDLKDGSGEYVAPGTYTVHGIVAPPIELVYDQTPYPNIEKYFPDRTPWGTGHSGPNGWLSDHSRNWAVQACGDKMYLGSTMAEAGVCLIECDLDGKKYWGKHDFSPWIGVGRLAWDGEAVIIYAADGKLHRLDPSTKKLTHIGWLGRKGRAGHNLDMAAANGQLYLAFGGEPYFDGAFAHHSVDQDACLPRLSGGARRDFLRGLRTTGSPPGFCRPGDGKRPSGGPLVYLESTFGSELRQHILVAFKEPVPIGSIVFPCPGGAQEQVEFAVLKPGGRYPPDPKRTDDWIAFGADTKPGWTCVPAPRGTTTRGLMVRFTRPGYDEIDDLLQDDEDDESLADITGEKWLGRLQGMKILRRRFRDVTSRARIRVNSGTASGSGEWDAKRTKAVWEDDPGIYMMEWSRAQKLRGLAIKEIDGAETKIDVWQGGGRPSMTGAAHDTKSKEPGWRNVATYKQRRRWAYVPSQDNNVHALYMDGYVDFNETVKTKAIRLRVVSQWLDLGNKGCEHRKHDGRGEHGVHFMNSITAHLDTRLCKVMDVAALEYVGGEPAVDPIVYRRLEVRDSRTGAFLREFQVDIGWNGMACGPKGGLFTIHRDHKRIIEIDTRTGRTRDVVSGIEPSKMTVGPDGRFYVFPYSNWGDHGPTDPVEVYDRAGRLVRTIGARGGVTYGNWDSNRIGDIADMAVDKRGQLWLAESRDNPRRYLVFDTGTGKLLKEFLGNTHYGGGGTIHKYDKSRVSHHGVEFHVDWRRHTSRIGRFLPMHGDFEAVKYRGRTYLVSLPGDHDPRQSYAAVYVDEGRSAMPRLVAAFGDATHFHPLRTSDIVTRMGGKPPQKFLFIWSDADGDGAADADEVTLEPKQKRHGHFGLGRFDRHLGCSAPDRYYEVARVMSDGTPVYHKRDLDRGGYLRLDNGNTFMLHGQYGNGGPSENYVTTPGGEKVWGYPASGGVSGLHIPAWQPGLVTNEFWTIGHETETRGDLGEFLVTHGNTGQWRVWTADGLLAGQIMLHKTDPRSKFFNPPEARPGMRLDPMTTSQEHFHGFFTKTEPDGVYRIVAGFNHLSLIEVRGLDKYRRFRKTVRVTRDDLRRARGWVASKARKRIQTGRFVLRASRPEVSPDIDGRAVRDEWTAPKQELNGLPVEIRVHYDDDNLYLAFRGKGLGQMKNGGREYQRYFKTGACVDFHIGTDPDADTGRTVPVRGDMRLLMAFPGGRPRAVLYQPKVSGAARGPKWSTYTEAGGRTSFESVAILESVEMAKGTAHGALLVEARIPLATLGLKPRPGVRYKVDWGVVTSTDGINVKQRIYWANPTATGTSDEAVEARLEPGLWGYLEFE